MLPTGLAACEDPWGARDPGDSERLQGSGGASERGAHGSGLSRLLGSLPPSPGAPTSWVPTPPADCACSTSAGSKQVQQQRRPTGPGEAGRTELPLRLVRYLGGPCEGWGVSGSNNRSCSSSGKSVSNQPHPRPELPAPSQNPLQRGRGQLSSPACCWGAGGGGHTKGPPAAMPQSRCQTLTPGQVCKGAKTQKQPKHRTPQQGSRAGQRRPLGAAGAPSADSAHSGHPPPSTDMGRGPTALWPGLSGPAPQERETQGPSLCLPPWKDNQCNGPCRLSPWDQPVPGTKRDTEEHSPQRPGGHGPLGQARQRSSQASKDGGGGQWACGRKAGTERIQRAGGW